jgi:para-nitrobenzyl esterase
MRFPLRAVAVSAAIGIIAGGLTVAPASARAGTDRSPDVAPSSLVVKTEQGRLAGSRNAQVDSFLGVPFAAPPVGDLRWRPPAPAPTWSGVRSATQLGPECPQLSGVEANEDCLQLNVFRPARASKRALPVLFYIHGGGFSYGSGRWHDGALLAKENGIVVVTINYRLGAFGFLNLPGLSRSGAGNYGLLDQVAALRWVNRNIAAFGGDPQRVTIAGLSAGGHSVCALLASPRTKGLFDGAVIQSAGCPSHTVAESTARGRAFAEAAGCAEPDTAVACLRAKDGETLLHSSRGFVGGILSGPLPTAGVPELPLAPDKAVRSGRFNNVPIMIGSTRDEVRQWAAPFADATPEQYEAALRATYGEHAPEVLAHYPLDPEDGRYAAAYALGAAWTDSSVFYGLGGCEYAELARTFARQQPRTFMYRFDDRTVPAGAPLPGFDSGAPHGSDSAYIWPSNTVLNDQQKQLSLEIVRYLGEFVKSGRPQAQGQANWPSFRTGRVMSQRLGGSETISRRVFDADHHCGMWGSIDYPWLPVDPWVLAEQVGVTHP